MCVYALCLYVFACMRIYINVSTLAGYVCQVADLEKTLLHKDQEQTALAEQLKVHTTHSHTLNLTHVTLAHHQPIRIHTHTYTVCSARKISKPMPLPS